MAIFLLHQVDIQNEDQRRSPLSFVYLPEKCLPCSMKQVASYLYMGFYSFHVPVIVDISLRGFLKKYAGSLTVLQKIALKRDEVASS